MVVRDGSMRPTFEPGDRLLVERYPGPAEGVPRGAVVVLKDPEEARRYLLKRVAAVAGDIVEPTRDGIRFPSPSDTAPPPVSIERVVVPAGHVYVISDLPSDGRDSRRFGPVPLGAIVGRPWRRTHPTARAGLLAPSEGPPNR